MNKKQVFEVINDTTGESVIVDSNANFKELLGRVNVSSEAMTKKAENETNLKRQKMMKKYAKRKAQIKNK